MDQYLFGGSVWEIPQSPQAVLYQSLTRVCEVKAKCLHATWKQQSFHGQTILNRQLPPSTKLKVNGLTSLNDGRFVTGANWQHFEHSTGGPQQFLICVGPHDVDQSLWASAGQNYKLKKTKPSILHLSNKSDFINKRQRTLCKRSNIQMYYNTVR